jgi:two-component system nitrate/nitrite response regulator NarL
MLFVFTSVPWLVVMDGPNGDDHAAIRIILADSQTVYRVGILQVLAAEIDMRVVAQTDTLAGVHRAVERLLIQPQTPPASTDAIMLLEDNMISAKSDVISQLVCRSPQLKIIAQSAQMDELNTVELFNRGVRGVIPRSISPTLLVKCVRRIAAGETWIDNQSVNWVIKAYRSLTNEMTAPLDEPRLTSKELSIIARITKGQRNKEIAHDLGTTEQVIKNCLSKLYDKLGVSDRVELAFYDLRHQLGQKQSGTGFLLGATVRVPGCKGGL